MEFDQFYRIYCDQGGMSSEDAVAANRLAVEAARKAKEQKLLDQFACAALTGLLSNERAAAELTEEKMGFYAMVYAKALLKARNEQA